MFVKFTVSNYLSFKDQTSIDLTATSLTEYRNDNIFQSPVGDLSLLKSVIVYGANASGKSNLFKAINFVKQFILNSSKETLSGEKISVERFKLSDTTQTKPSAFEIEFIVSDIKYRYGFEVDKFKVHSEHLYFQKINKEYPIFTRTFQTIEIGKKIFFPSENLFSITRENTLFLSVCAQFNDHLSISLVNKINQFNFISGFDDLRSTDYTIKMLADKQHNIMVNNLLRSAKLGFNEIRVEKISSEEFLPNASKELQRFLSSKRETSFITTKHNVYDENNEVVGERYFNLNSEESLGTRKFFALAGPIINAITTGSILLIDEFDSRLHPELSKGIIKLFNSTLNVYNAQLVITSHNSTFINSNNKLFRRDQVIVADKNKIGMTRFESLFQKKVRKDASFEKDYLSGKYDGNTIELDISNQLNLFED